VKLALAKTRLSEKGKCASLAELADSCGFSDQSHMTRVFKERFGVTPAVYEN
jgi:AraC-like DNA-binding protein